MTDVWLTIRYYNQINHDVTKTYGIFSYKDKAIEALKGELEKDVDGVEYREMNPGYVLFISGQHLLGQVVKVEVDTIINCNL